MVQSLFCLGSGNIVFLLFKGVVFLLTVKEDNKDKNLQGSLKTKWYSESDVHYREESSLLWGL